MIWAVLAACDRTPADVDGDRDGLGDREEAALGTARDRFDTDGDGLGDGEEARGLGTDPLRADTDGDGLRDADERDLGTDPLATDSDFDGLADGDELATDPLSPDSDGDGLGDGVEVETDPARADTDGDGLDDGVERAAGTDPLRADSDGDRLGDAEELGLGTDPLTADSDGGGIDDREEVRRGLDPRDVQDDVELVCDWSRVRVPDAAGQVAGELETADYAIFASFAVGHHALHDLGGDAPESASLRVSFPDAGCAVAFDLSEAAVWRDPATLDAGGAAIVAAWDAELDGGDASACAPYRGGDVRDALGALDWTIAVGDLGPFFAARLADDLGADTLAATEARYLGLWVATDGRTLREVGYAIRSDAICGEAVPDPALDLHEVVVDSAFAVRGRAEDLGLVCDHPELAVPDRTIPDGPGPAATAFTVAVTGLVDRDGRFHDVGIDLDEDGVDSAIEPAALEVSLVGDAPCRIVFDLESAVVADPAAVAAENGAALQHAWSVTLAGGDSTCGAIPGFADARDRFAGPATIALGEPRDTVLSVMREQGAAVWPLYYDAVVSGLFVSFGDGPLVEVGGVYAPVPTHCDGRGDGVRARIDLDLPLALEPVFALELPL